MSYRNDIAIERYCNHCGFPEDAWGCQAFRCVMFNRELRSSTYGIPLNRPRKRPVAWGSFESDDSWFYDEVEQSKGPFEYIGK